MRFSGSIRVNLLLVVLLGVLPMLAVIVSSGIERRENEIDHARKTALRLAESYAFTQVRELERVEKILADLAATPPVRTMDEAACNALFKEYLRANPNYANFALMDAKGFAVSSALAFKKPKDLSKRKEVANALATRAFSIGEYSVGRVSKLQILPVASPVLAPDGRLVGVLIASLKLQGYASEFQHANLPAGSFVGLVDREGNRLLRYPEGDRPIGEKIPQRIWSRLASVERSGMFTAAGGDGVPMVFAVRRLTWKADPVPFSNLFVAIPEPLVIAGADAVTARYLWWGGLSFVSSILLAWLIGYYAIHARVVKLMTVARRLGAGDLKARSGLDMTRGEIGSLAQAFDAMADALEQDSVERKRAQHEAEMANSAKTIFLANMSHEIRTPLNGLMGMLQLLNTMPLDAGQKDYVGYALQSCRRLTRLLSDILDLSKVEAGKVDVVMAPFDFREGLKAVEQLFAAEAQQKGLQLRFGVSPDIPARLCGDSARLQQVLNNLVGNAVKFTPQGVISVDAHLLPMRTRGECRVLIRVSDTGIGIEDEMQGRLFTPFTQVEENFARQFQGAGLGLAICKRLVTLMGGTMAVESEAGIGSTFYCSLPFGLTESFASSPSIEGYSECQSGLRVLLVDDDAISARVLVDFLARDGHRADVAGDGQAALTALQDKEYDLVFMDVQMPILDGVQATRAIRDGKAGERNREIPIIAVTAYASTGNRQRFLKAGMDEYLTKPLDMAEVSQAMSRLLSESGARGRAQGPAE